MMPFGTFAPSALKRAGSLRKSTTSCSSALASSAPATCDHSTADAESGVISVGFVFGISFSVRHRKKTSRPMKMIGAHVMIQLSTWNHCSATVSMAPVSPLNLERRLGPGPHSTDVLSRGGSLLRAQDLRERRSPDLELALVGLARADDALDLEAGAPDRARGPRVAVALAPREHLDGRGGRGERHGTAGQRARPFDDLPQQQRAGDVGGQHRRDQVRAAAV